MLLLLDKPRKAVGTFRVRPDTSSLVFIQIVFIQIIQIKNKLYVRTLEERFLH